MLYLSDIRDWLKTFNASQNYYIGKLDNKKECSIGVYQRNAVSHIRSLGDLSSYDVKQVSILIHWNKNARETEKRAMYLFNQIKQAQNVMINEHHVHIIDLLYNEPVDVGTDDSGVYERVIELDLYFERKESEE